MTTSRKNPRSWGDDYTPTTKGQHTMAHDAAYSECLASFPEGIRKTTAESGIYTDSLGGKWEVCWSSDGGIEYFALLAKIEGK